RAPDRFRDRHAAENNGQPELITSSHEDPINLLDVVEPFALARVIAKHERQRLRLVGAELAKQLLVPPTGVLELRRGRDDDDARAFATRDIEELPQDVRRTLFVLGAADRNDEASLVVPFDFRWAHRLLFSPSPAPRTKKHPRAMTSRTR